MSTCSFCATNPDCQACGLYCHQKPLTEPLKASPVICVGLSAKLSSCKDEIPLDPRTISGNIILEIEKAIGFSFYKTNLVKCVPLDEIDMLRYPEDDEIAHCIPHLKGEIEEVQPKVVLLLGNKVATGVAKHRNMPTPKFNGYQYHTIEHNGVKYIAIQHPSYIYVYKRKEMKQYINAVANTIRKEITDAD